VLNVEGTAVPALGGAPAGHASGAAGASAGLAAGLAVLAGAGGALDEAGADRLALAFPPFPSLFYAAGFAFARGASLADAPPDPALRHVFFGEETAQAARLWTAGYALYAPGLNVVYHLWSRAHRPLFREHADAWSRAQQAAAYARLQSLLGLASGASGGSRGDTDRDAATGVDGGTAGTASGDGAGWTAAAGSATHVSSDPYGLGTERPLASWPGAALLARRSAGTGRRGAAPASSTPAVLAAPAVHGGIPAACFDT
jgi:hypothetical protein